MKKTIISVLCLLLVFLAGCGYGHITSSDANGYDSDYPYEDDYEDYHESEYCFGDEYVLWEYVSDHICDDPTLVMGTLHSLMEKGDLRYIEWNGEYQDIWINEEY